MGSAEAARSKAAAGVAGRVGSNPATSFRAAARVRRATLREAVPEQAALDRDRALTEDRPAEAGTRAAAVRIAALGQAPVERQVAEGEPTGARGDVVLRGRTLSVSADEEEAEVRRRCGTGDRRPVTVDPDVARDRREAVGPVPVVVGSGQLVSAAVAEANDVWPRVQVRGLDRPDE